MTTVLGALLVAAAVLMPAPADASHDPSITISGGGWGHAIGMPQYAARGMAEDGWSATSIVDYFYTGTSQTDLPSTNGASLPDHLRIGTTTVAGQIRPFRWLDVSAVGGPVGVCLDGESAGGCSYTAQPGEVWRIGWNTSSAGCTIDRNSTRVWGPGACDIRLEWANQPDVRVSVPEVGRVFARGSIEFSGPVTYNGSTGFHFIVELTMDEYLYGLGEMPTSWPAAALEAQAITARTFAAETTRRRLIVNSANDGLRPDCSCHLVWSTSDQSYRGWSSLTEGNATTGARWRDAVDATAGDVVVHPAGGTRLAETYYSSSTGGATENVWDVWGSSPTKYSYLASVPDPWSGRYADVSSTVRWTTTRSASSIATALGFDSLASLRVISRYESGSPSTIEAVGTIGGNPTTRTYTGGGLKSLLGLTGHHIYTISGFGTPERVAGPDRYATAVAVSSELYPSGAATVYLAVGTNHPDALAAGPAAAVDGAPLLLTDPDSLSASTRAELIRLGPTRVVVLGGPAAIGEVVVADLSEALPGASIERRFGPTRYETAVAISAAVFPSGPDTVWIVTGNDFPDALVTAPVAAMRGEPLLLVGHDVVPDAVAAELDRLSPNRIVVVGGTASVSETVEAELAEHAGIVTRLSAPDRYALSALVAATHLPTASNVYVATGERFPDALAAGPLATMGLGPILLVRGDEIPAAVADELRRIGRLQLVVLGGPAAVSESVFGDLAPYL